MLQKIIIKGIFFLRMKMFFEKQIVKTEYHNVSYRMKMFLRK